MGSVVMVITIKLSAQTNLQFTSVNVTDENAIQLHWTSQPSHIYEVDEADALIDTNTGSITWNKLYDDYPSQGTNTFWLDTGNYFNTPIIPHPKNMPMRFYRIVDTGPDGLTNDEPSVSIISPTNGFSATGSLTVTVVPYTDQAGPVSTKLYVDGQAMWPSADGSNYVINTCEWGNGSHILFATVECLSAPEGYFGAPAALVGHGVSSFVPVIFSNLVTRISFSQPFFQPSLGQTQQVSAVFAANSDWTMQIKDAFGNVVRNASGSGDSMLYNWDGLGDGETNIPAGVYYYYISATTNGEPDEDVIVGGSDGGSPPSPALARSSVASLNSSELWAVAPDSEDVVPLAIYPPGFDTNNLTIFAASPAEIRSLTPSVSSSDSLVAGGGGVHADDASAPSPQNTPPTPQRPPTSPMANSAGTVGVAYFNYAANGLAGFSPTRPTGSQGPNLGTINMEGATTNPVFAPLRNASAAANFAYEMSVKGGWRVPVNLANDQLTISQLRSSGSGNPFNQVDIGLLNMHGVYGSSFDYNAAANCKQMYFPIPSGTGSQYIRMSEMNFGGSAPGVGLKWMALMACSSLHQANWQTMQSQNIKPYNSNLHMILGADTEFEDDPSISQRWADYMIGDPAHGTNAVPIRQAWYQAASDAYHAPLDPNSTHIISPMRFATVYDTACINDYLQTQTNTVLNGGAWGKDTVEVYPAVYTPH